jgi:thiol-disulfide isomerase/thioredoxin
MYIFVADWCPYCRQAKAAIFELMEKYYKNNNLILIEDSSEDYKTIGLKLEATMLPAFIIADEEGNKVTTHDGERSFKDLLKFYVDNTDTEMLDEDK